MKVLCVNALLQASAFPLLAADEVGSYPCGSVNALLQASAFPLRVQMLIRANAMC